MVKRSSRGSQSSHKGARTREQVIEAAAALFNSVGYQATSISDVMAATGLKKGGIYRHFESKQQLSLLAFEFAVEQMRQRFHQALQSASTPEQRLRAVIGVYARIPKDPPVPGGCPILNASVEADDGDPELRSRAQQVLNGLRRVVEGALKEGQESGTFSADMVPKQAASMLIASVEGAVMLSKLYGTQAPMTHVVRHLDEWLEGLKRH